ncbi:MAG: hypothetical protein K9H64_19300 [Bacteroidales bacterium]|nr:hypothetical protein [Bacteroidales bacterium]MCF8458209.1 hypothetical protein [Bacteroidales bacterium]
MEHPNDIQAYGCVTKKETLASYSQGESFKEFVLEANEPFPGYYCAGNLPFGKSCKPSYLFFIIKPAIACTEDYIIRVTQKIKQLYKFDFDACPGQLTLFNNLQPHIRIHTEDLSIIPDLIKAYKENGIVFQKNKKVKPYTSMIRIKKYFDLEYISEGVFKLRDNEFFKYIRIPKEIDWKSFETITMTIKNTYDFKNYDYALSAIYQKCGFEDYVRIFSENCDCSKLPMLRQKYVEEIGKQVF